MKNDGENLSHITYEADVNRVLEAQPKETDNVDDVSSKTKRTNYLEEKGYSPKKIEHQCITDQRKYDLISSDV